MGGKGYFYPNKRINFVLPEALTNTPTILVDNLTVLIEDNILTAISLTTTRPTTITVSGQTQTIRLKRLKKQDVITINLIHKNKKKTYFLRTLPISFPHLYVEKQTSVIPSGYVLISFHGLKLQHPSYSVIMDMAGNVVYYRGNKNPSYSMFHLKKWELENKKVFYSMHEQDEKSIDTSWVTGHHLIFDEKFNLVDKVQILPTDTHGELLAQEHEIVVLGEKHYIVIGCGSSNECSARLYDKDMNVLWTLMAEYPYKMYRAYWVRTLN